MRHLTARQKGDGGGWHYVSLGSQGGYPLGYCAEHEPHATETEARECYAAWVRDSIEMDRRTTNWTDCEVPGCDQPTKGLAEYARDGYHAVSLCPAHMTREAVIELCGLDKPAGDAWKS